MTVNPGQMNADRDRALVPPLLYLSGPMTGVPEFNAPLFRSVAGELRRQGYRVFVPHDLSKHDQSLPWALYMRWAIRALMDCDEIVMLPGWKESKGAMLEYQIASALGMPIRHWTPAA